MKNLRLSHIRYFIIVFLFLINCNSGCVEKFEYEAAPLPDPNVGVDMVTWFKSKPEYFSQLSEAIERTGLNTLLSSGQLTIFAPDNRAWSTYFKSSPYSTIADIPQEELHDLLLHHVIDEKLLGNAFTVEPQKFTPLFGADLSVSVNNDYRTNRLYRIIVNGIQVRVSNIEPTNGAIHIIMDNVLKN